MDNGSTRNEVSERGTTSVLVDVYESASSHLTAYRRCWRTVFQRLLAADNSVPFSLLDNNTPSRIHLREYTVDEAANNHRDIVLLFLKID